MFRVAVALGGIGVDTNLRILQVIGSPEGRKFLAWLIEEIGVVEEMIRRKAPSGLRPKNLASTSLAAKLLSQDVDGQIPCR
ncbi:hypothetical protein Taro_023909 [Colocasia esculenta]|uniref:Uncharacterized protein n=1 Tax=Colocasia esculenta TaxID=4460 RepID=A0A843VC58_COLES|nr:hypothetical protein [Colocasia esculenta]